MPLREERHPRPEREKPHRARAVLRWLPEVLVLALVAGAFAIVAFDLSDRLFGDLSDEGSGPAAIEPPAGLDLPEQPVAEPVAATATPPDQPADADAVRRALAPYVDSKAFGPHSMVVVSDLTTGAVIYRRGGGTVTPASTMKLLTAAAALDALGPTTRFRTTVRLQGAFSDQTGEAADSPELQGGRITLVGGGDPFLMSDPAAAKGLYPARADLGTLAARTAEGLSARGVRWVRLGYDASLFTGPRISPDWPATYVPENVVPPITALWADQGVGADGRYVADPPAVAAGIFAKALRAQGIEVRGPIAQRPAAASSTEIATIASAPLAEMVEHTVAVSDNNAAEVIAHQVGLAVGQDASFAGGAAAVAKVLTELGVPLAGTEILDGSGLSRKNLLTPAALLAVIRVAASQQQDALRAVVTGLPVAGFTGSLRWRFEKGPDDAKGRVRAKTGTLTGVHGLAGIATDLDGDQLAFVAIADRVPLGSQLAARMDLDRMAAALGACHCGSTRKVSP